MFWQAETNQQINKLLFRMNSLPSESLRHYYYLYCGLLFTPLESSLQPGWTGSHVWSLESQLLTAHHKAHRGRSKWMEIALPLVNYDFSMWSEQTKFLLYPHLCTPSYWHRPLSGQHSEGYFKPVCGYHISLAWTLIKKTIYRLSGVMVDLMWILLCILWEKILSDSFTNIKKNLTKYQ